MSDVKIHTSRGRQVTCVPNTFIDHYMRDANGEYVKVYLYLLRCLEDRHMDLSLPGIADHLDLTEKDVRRALSYWESVQILRLEYNAQDHLTGICMLNLPETENSAPGPDQISGTVSPAIDAARGGNAPEKDPSPDKNAGTVTEPTGSSGYPSINDRPAYSPEQINAFSADESVRELLYVAQAYFGRPLTHKEIETILYWKDSLRFSSELIEYLIEYCIDNSHPSIYYMDRVALSWAEEKICDPQEARKRNETRSSVYRAVMNEFGIRDRAMAASEQEHLRHWIRDLGFSEEIVVEACRRTIANISRPSFEYANTILNSWHRQGVTSPADITQLDARHMTQQKTSADNHKASGQMQAAKAQAAANKKNRFHNFSQRDYDIAALEDALIKN